METLSKNKIKWIRSFQLKKNRDAAQLFIVEGDKMVNELIDNHVELIECVVSTNDSFISSKPTYLADSRIMRQISNLTTPSQLLAVVRMKKKEVKDAKFILALDGIQDPGNMGTILRTADWFGVDKIICAKNTVDVYNFKVVQASMGSVFRMPIDYCNLHDYLQNMSLPIFGALLNGENIYTQELKRKGIVVMGNEGSGISDPIQALIQTKIHIPRFGKSESLNVAVATAIILSEFSRK